MSQKHLKDYCIFSDDGGCGKSCDNEICSTKIDFAASEKRDQKVFVQLLTNAVIAGKVIR